MMTSHPTLPPSSILPWRDLTAVVLASLAATTPVLLAARLGVPGSREVLLACGAAYAAEVLAIFALSGMAGHRRRRSILREEER